MNTILAKFWSEVRKSNGDYYGRNSLFNLRAMINKHLKGKPYCVPFDIVTDERFRSSNERLEKQLKLLKGIGRTITHKQPISIADLRRMYDSGVLGTSNPLSLLRKVSSHISSFTSGLTSGHFPSDFFNNHFSGLVRNYTSLLSQRIRKSRKTSQDFIRGKNQLLPVIFLYFRSMKSLHFITHIF